MVKLSIYDYKIKLKQGRLDGNTDGISTLTVKDEERDIVKYFSVVKELQNCFKDIAISIDKDNTLNKLKEYVKHSWRE